MSVRLSSLIIRFDEFIVYDLPFEKVSVKEEPFDGEDILDEEVEQIYITVVSDFETDLDNIKMEINEELIKNENEFEMNNSQWEVKREQGDDGKSLCYICGKTITRIKPHMRRHFREFKCNLCSEAFRNSKELEKHLVYHGKNRFPCEHCDLNFETSMDLIRHTRKHLNVYKCIYCSFKTTHLASITAHLNRHEDNVKFRCECGRGFSTKYLMENHKQIHYGIKQYQCDYCSKKFTTENYRKCHMKLNHSKELTGIATVYKCQVCFREFSFEKSLVRHLSVIHDIGESRRVKCPVCSKVIANNFNLKMHMTVHTGEKRHVCELCGKAFRDRAHLKRHCKVHAKRGEFLYL